MAKLQKNQIVSVRIDDLAYGGMGVGRVDDFVVFVEKALPGERVTARITKKRSSHAMAVIESIDQPSPDRIDDPPCPLFGVCGGCSWQHFPYEQQIVWKQKQVLETIRRIGGLEDFDVEPIIGSPEIWRYRNKMEFTFGGDKEGRPILGFHLPGRHDRIFRVPACLIHPEPLDAMLGVVESFARESNLLHYSQGRHVGFLRHAVMRYSHTTGESILILITHKGDLPDRERLAQRLKSEVPGFKGMIWGLNTGVADVARVERELWRWGEPELIETVNELTFAISPLAFFQTNTSAAGLLYRSVVEMAELGPKDLLLDAYCGAGAIALYAAPQVARVVGVESVRDAIWDARANARSNGIDNATFLAAAMPQGLALARAAAGGAFTRVIIDPPRGGMDKRSLNGLIALRAPTFIYVSCNPATLARDLQTMTAAGYVVDRVQPIDLFPHTYHVEVVVRLRLA